MSYESSYNGVVFKHSHTTNFHQTMKYDESGTDVVYNEFLIRFEGSVHADQSYFHGVTAPGSHASATSLVDEIRARLSHPGGTFRHQVDDNILIEATGATSGVSSSTLRDVNNGPKPKSLRINKIFGGKLYRVEFEIEVAIVLCKGAQRPSNVNGAPSMANVLNNRWSVEEVKDKDFYTTRTLEGTMRVSNIKAWPHMFRYLVVPRLQRGYQRQSSRFVDSRDGLTLNYQIVDRQRYAAPPEPAVDWTSSYTLSTTNAGTKSFADVVITLTGAPDTPKQELLAAAASIVRQRIVEDDAKYYPVSSSITEHMDRNAIDLRVRRWREVDEGFINMQTDRIGLPLEIPGHDPKKWITPKPFDSSAPHGMFFKYLQSPCFDVHGAPNPLTIDAPRSPNPEDDPQEPQSPEPEVGQGSGEPLFQTPTGVSTLQTGQFPYTYVELRSEYRTTQGKAHLPIARFSSAPTSRATSIVAPLFAPITKRVITMHAERFEDWPDLPAPVEAFTDRNGIRHHLVDGPIVVPESVQRLSDGLGRLFSIQIKLVYAMERAPTPREKLDAGADPRYIDGLDDNVFDGARHYNARNFFRLSQ